MGNPSLIYEILMYLNSFYFGVFATCEIGKKAYKLIKIRIYLIYFRDGNTEICQPGL